MVELYDSHEQSERVKGWLRENGSAIVMGLVLAFGGLFGFKQWQVWETSKSEQASAEYETMVEFLTNDQLDAAVSNYESLKSEFPTSSYTSLAALHMASARIESGQAELAIGLLEDAALTAEPAPVKSIAKVRLARLYLDQEDPEAALRTLDEITSTTGFESRIAEVRGDIYRHQGNKNEAIVEYQKALDLQETGIGYRPLLEMKLETLTGMDTQEVES